MSGQEREREKSIPIDLQTRLALRQREAAMALGISERKLREISPRLPAVRIDGIVLYPVQGLRRWLETEAQAQEAHASALADELLRDTNG